MLYISNKNRIEKGDMVINKETGETGMLVYNGKDYYIVTTEGTLLDGAYNEFEVNTYLELIEKGKDLILINNKLIKER